MWTGNRDMAILERSGVTNVKVLSFSGDSTQNPCPGGRFHNHAGSGDYKMVINGYDMDDSFNAHETGQCPGFDHSWSADPGVEYGESLLQCKKEYGAPG